MAKSLKPLIDPSCVGIAELDGEPIGFGIALPNLNELIARLRGQPAALQLAQAAAGG